jgi:hypothetical protein
MSFLKGIVGALKWVVTAPFIGIDYALNALADAGERLRGAVVDLTGVGKKKSKAAKKAEANAELRRQWLEVAEGAKDRTDGVEYEGEIYYDTVH